MKNTYTEPEAEAEPQLEEKEVRSKKRFSQTITGLLNGEFLTREGMVKHMSYVVFLCGIFLLYIFLGYQFEQIERKKSQTKRQLEELSAEYKTLKSELEAKKQQSNVARDIASLGLIEPISPPPTIEADPSYFEE
ncbi:MAG: FtsL-like putative cell division protein [Flavobacteriales bacterium]|jgi:hypothetical protein|nr:FtsL-like putative cell division protein [Flavobacteriales bacterium]MDP4953862.1 FtsL-like putative cell division protein [Flavobacteriales bacterium]